jgi:hypothetical protein
MTIQVIRGVPPKFSFKLNLNEYGYKEKFVMGAHEFDLGKFLVIMNGSN